MPSPNRLPQMAAAKDLTLSVAPAGGVNYSRLENRIDDGQLSDVLNFWYKDSMLRMRPGLVKRIEQQYGRILDVCPKDGSELLLKRLSKNGVVSSEIYGMYFVTEKGVFRYYDQTIEQIPTQVEYSEADDTWTPTYLDFQFTQAFMIETSVISDKAYGGLESANDEYEVQSQEVLLFAVNKLLPGGAGFFKIYPQGIAYITMSHFSVYSGVLISSVPEIALIGLMNSALYVPTICTNMKPSGAGDVLESRNLLNPQVKNEFFTNATDTVYHLVDQNLEVDPIFTDVTATYDDLHGTQYDFSFFVADSDSKNGLTATLSRTDGTITFSKPLIDASAAQAKAPNLTVTYCKFVYGNPGPVAKCSIAAWFGGARQGEKSGDCLFVSGNPDEPTAVYWSAVGDPTYWPAENIDYIGEPSDPITAFAKVFGSLVIFKQSSVYEKGFSWDATNSQQYFPTSEIRVGMGCDCPGSIQLINNSLVWLNSRLGMLVLTTTSTSSSTSNIYTERVIQPLSANINAALLAEALADRQGAVSVDDGQYYRLFIGKRVYLWDYSTTPFINLSDTSRLQNRLAWYIWEIPHAVSSVFLRDTAVWVVAEEDNAFYSFDETAALDEGSSWFDAYLITKGYDFGASNLLKQMYFAAFTLANKDTVLVDLSVIDDQDTSSREEVLDGHDDETVSAVSYWEKSAFTRAVKLKIQRPPDEKGSFAVVQIELRAKLGRAA